MDSLISTNFYFKGQKNFYRGKVRDVYNINNQYLAMVACDRISAFDVVLPKPIPYKGQVLNQIADTFLQKTALLVPNWRISSPDPNVTIGHYCKPFKIEMVIRGYLSGHAWREYKAGKRTICGEPMPEGMKENDKFPEPIITPTIKAHTGHDEDITKAEILERGFATAEQYAILENYTQKLFAFGSDFAQKRGLLLVDTKYEFGLNKNNEILLIDEVHTPDSSRYFYADTYDEIQQKDQQQRQLSKEFVRQWLIQNGFQGREGELIPEMTTEYIQSVTDRYIELFEQITGEEFIKQDYNNAMQRIEKSIHDELERLG
ncbi:MAG: phosphoribosylaminoimidazolesuccinocarboxamide synthase [Bacteroidia bacterium]